MKRPSFQFYPSDWLRDIALRSCSIGARGLWIDMLCFMHDAQVYGYLKVGNKVILPPNLARMTGLTLEETEGYLDELKEANVFDVDSEGVIFSRRMIRDEKLRKTRAEGGKLGGNPNLKVNLKDNLSDKNKVKQKQTPSSSSSSSSSSSYSSIKKEKPEPKRNPSETQKNPWVSQTETKKTSRVTEMNRSLWASDVSEQTWSDWCELRNKKKAVVNKTVIEGARAEAKKLGITLDETLKMWVLHGWQGFKAEWVLQERNKIAPKQFKSAEERREERADKLIQEILEEDKKKDIIDITPDSKKIGG